MFQKILFPIDFSPTSEQVLPFVIDMAKKYSAQVFLLYVAEDPGHYANMAVPHPSIATFIGDLEKAAGKKMKEFFDEHYDELQGVERRVVVGEPDLAIIKFAEENRINLIIMGTHGRKGLDRVIFGSVAENVTRNSPVPVMTINPHRMNQGG